MVDIDVDIQDARVMQEELKNGEHNIIDVAETRRFGLLGVVQPARPIDGDVGLPVGEHAGSIEGCTAVERAVVPQPIKDRAVVPGTI